MPPQEQFGPEHSTSLRALDMLGHEVFFTSPRLAALSTQAEILSVQLQAAQAAAPKQQLLQAVQQAQQAQQLGGSCSAECGCSQGAAAGMGGGLAASLACRQRMLEEYQCPICLETLHNPVVLTCAHRCVTCKHTRHGWLGWYQAVWRLVFSCACCMLRGASNWHLPIPPEETDICPAGGEVGKILGKSFRVQYGAWTTSLRLA